MNEYKISIDEKVVSKSAINITSIGKFLNVVANAIISGIASGDIKYYEETIACEKCGREVTEYNTSILAKVNLGLFIIKPTVTIKALYDEKCGLRYVRLKFGK